MILISLKIRDGHEMEDGETRTEDRERHPSIQSFVENGMITRTKDGLYALRREVIGTDSKGNASRAESRRATGDMQDCVAGLVDVEEPFKTRDSLPPLEQIQRRFCGRNDHEPHLVLCCAFTVERDL